MNRITRVALGVAFVLVVGLVAGCQPAGATVTGKVTYEGKSVDEGNITFTPADGKGKDAGGEIKDGSYEVKGVPPGPKVVRIIAVKKVNFASTSEEMQQKAEAARKAGNHDGLVDPADIIPENAEGNNAKIEVKAGLNKLDFNLKRPAKK